ncbi:hypothetical protein KAR91_12775 [Candidatus Pacearchaeota archaeon]|nr:hypothetical protein [Candidatus Pacearchaeota archaeon]
MDYDLDTIKARFAAAKTARSVMDQIYKDVYRFAIPYRDMMDTDTPGQDNTPEIYDSTAVDSTESFGNFLHSSMTPPEFRWFAYTAGTDITPAMKERVQTLLDGVTQRFFQLLWSTNFDTEINQSYRDLAAGTGVLAIRDYGEFGSEENAATFVATPPYNVYFAEGREGEISEVYREFKVRPERVKIIWPTAKYTPPEGTDKKKNVEEVTVIECCYFDYDSKQYYYKVFMGEDAKTFIVDEEMKYASWLVFRWSTVTGEIFGRGPLVNAIADIKTANKVVELVLQNASISLSGIYTAVDDGVLNPNNIELTPGTIIPVASNGGSLGRSLDLLPRSKDFDVSELVLRDIRQSIRRKLLDDDIAPLDDAVRSSREVGLRQQMASQRAGPSIGRLRQELIFRLVKELTTMWQVKGLLPPFEIDGKNITLRFTSPLAQLQNQEDLQGLDTYIARMNTLSPNSAQLVVKPEEYAHYVAEKTGVQMDLINSKDDLIKAQQIMGQKIAEGGPEAQSIVEGFQV